MFWRLLKGHQGPLNLLTSPTETTGRQRHGVSPPKNKNKNDFPVCSTTQKEVNISRNPDWNPDCQRPCAVPVGRGAHGMLGDAQGVPFLEVAPTPQGPPQGRGLNAAVDIPANTQPAGVCCMYGTGHMPRTQHRPWAVGPLSAAAWMRLLAAQAGPSVLDGWQGCARRKAAPAPNVGAQNRSSRRGRALFDI